MSRSSIIFAVLAVFFVPGTSSCSSQSGGTSSDTPSAYPQSILDADVVWATYSGVDDIYNQNLAGKPVGTQSLQGKSCPLGGTVNITGTTAVATDNGITSVDLQYEMTSCKMARTSKDGNVTLVLTLSGTINDTGSFNSSTHFDGENFQSSSLSWTGTAHRSGYVDETINETCPFSASVSQSSSGGQTSGSICGRTVSWSF